MMKGSCAVIAGVGLLHPAAACQFHEQVRPIEIGQAVWDVPLFRHWIRHWVGWTASFRRRIAAHFFRESEIDPSDTHHIATNLIQGLSIQISKNPGSSPQRNNVLLAHARWCGWTNRGRSGTVAEVACVHANDPVKKEQDMFAGAPTLSRRKQILGSGVPWLKAIARRDNAGAGSVSIDFINSFCNK